MSNFGDSVIEKIIDKPLPTWNEEIAKLAGDLELHAGIYDPGRPESFPSRVPKNVIDRAAAIIPIRRLEGSSSDTQPMPPPRPPPRGPEQRPPRKPRNFDDLPGRPIPDVPDLSEASLAFLPKSRPAFLMEGTQGDGYWAGVLLHLPQDRRFPRHPILLLIRADRLDGSGMFFDFKPLLWGGLAVLVLSLAFWTPFVWCITRYIRRIKSAADQIATGNFQLSLPKHSNDELGDLSRTIETMAARLDHLIAGQKRFLGDAAHELCAPLARIRTGLGILEMKLSDSQPKALESIEADAAELATLVNEILAFSRVGNRPAAPQEVSIEPLIRQAVARETPELSVDLKIPPKLSIRTDPTLLSRAIGNILRNAAIYAGAQAHVFIEVSNQSQEILISITDDGPGVPSEELQRLFEPFYRPDRSRTRDTGGSGLGLSIVRTAIEACGGKVIASLPENGGFRVTLHLPKA